jgi:hypothetical protein
VFLLIYAELSIISRSRITVSVAKVIHVLVRGCKSESRRRILSFGKGLIGGPEAKLVWFNLRSSNCQAHPRFIVEFYSICWP